MPVKVTVDSETCLGCGACVGSFPETFDFDENGKATVKGEIDEAAADDAIATCPVGAISK